MFTGILPHHAPFLSTLSLRRATMYALKLADPMLFLSTLSLRRATHGRYSLRRSASFLSTLSLRRATIAGYLFCTMQIISIHALLAESDPIQANILKL